MSTAATNAGQMASGPNPLRSDVEALRADIDKLKSAMTDLGRDAGRFAKDGLHEARVKASEAAAAGLDYTKAAAAATAELGKKSIDRTENQIKMHPWMSVGIAFGAGLLLGAVISRR